MTEHTPGPWAWLDDSLIAPDDQIVLQPCDNYFSPELLKCSDADKALIAAAPEIRAELDKALFILKQAIPFVIAWANDHSGPDADATRIGIRLASRMQAAVDTGKVDTMLTVREGPVVTTAKQPATSDWIVTDGLLYCAECGVSVREPHESDCPYFTPAKP